MGQYTRGGDYRTDYAFGRTPEDGRSARTGARSSVFFVKRVIDGDTLRLSGGEKVRLIGVDTPETKRPGEPIEYFGPEAYRFTKNEIEKRSIRMNRERKPRDRYFRLLAYVFRDPGGFFLNAEIVKQGFGHAYTKYPFRYLREFVELERQARSMGLGLWAGSNVSREAALSGVDAHNERSGAPIVQAVTAEAGATGKAAPKNMATDGTQKYWGSSKSSKFHYPSCRWAKAIKADNLATFKSRQEATSKGYTACKDCKP